MYIYGSLIVQVTEPWSRPPSPPGPPVPRGGQDHRLRLDLRAVWSRPPSPPGSRDQRDWPWRGLIGQQGFGTVGGGGLLAAAAATAAAASWQPAAAAATCAGDDRGTEPGHGGLAARRAPCSPRGADASSASGRGAVARAAESQQQVLGPCCVGGGQDLAGLRRGHECDRVDSSPKPTGPSGHEVVPPSYSSLHVDVSCHGGDRDQEHD